MDIFYKPWPWYVAGPLIGLSVPALLLFGNKRLGISSTLRQICAACYPAKIPFLNYDWKKDSWNLFFVGGILIGGFLGGFVFANQNPVDVATSTADWLRHRRLENRGGLLPEELFNWENLLTLQGFLLMVMGGFFIGFGTRYAGGCTSGHGIFGLGTLQWTSLLAVLSFFVGGIICSHFLLPFVLSL